MPSDEPPRQFVGVKFNPWDQREYTYHHTGAPLVKGDKCIVETAKGEAEVVVETLHDYAPPFATKPIKRKVTP